PWKRGEVMLNILKDLSGTIHLEVLGESLQALLVPWSAQWPGGDIEIRRRLFRSLAGYIVNLPLPQIHDAWLDAMKTLSARPRSELLSDLGGFAAVVRALAGNRALEQSAVAVRQVQR